MPGYKESDAENCGAIKYKSCHSVGVKPGFFNIMRFKGIDDVENHTQEDDSHAEADGNDKYGIQFSDKRYGRHTVHRPQPQSRYDILKSKDTSEHQTEKCGKDSGAADDSGKIDMLQLVQEQSSDKEQESLSCITEHGSENKGVGDGNKPGGVHLAIGGKSVHFYIHFKGFEKLRVFQLGRRLMVLVVFRRIGIFSVYQAEDFFVG